MWRENKISINEPSNSNNNKTHIAKKKRSNNQNKAEEQQQQQRTKIQQSQKYDVEIILLSYKGI